MPERLSLATWCTFGPETCKPRGITGLAKLSDTTTPITNIAKE
jgi:hypothetical protein